MPRTKTIKIPQEQEEKILILRDLPQSRAIQEMANILGGLSTLDPKRSDSTWTIATLSNAIRAATEHSKNSAQAAPGDIVAMMRFAEFVYRLEGDVAQSIDIPWEVIGGGITISSDDTGAEKTWNELWRQYDEDGDPIIDIDEIHESCYFDGEINAQWFPLELWDGNNWDGLAVIEPQAMWVGRPISEGNIKSPGDLPDEKLESLRHKFSYSYRGGDPNIQGLPGSNIPIKESDMRPVFSRKRPYQRYAYPHVTRASRNIMQRFLLREYREGTIETFTAQIGLFTIGSDKLPATPSMINAFTRKVQNAVMNRSGFIVANHTAKGEILTPKTLDGFLGHEAITDLTQAIMRDLGFNLWLLSGEMPGGRGAGAAVDTALQYAIARWKYRNAKFIKWAEYISRKYAKRNNSKALLDHLPKFTPFAISVEQAQAIKDRIMPLVMAGLLDPQQALKDAGYDYNKVVANKKAHKPNEEMFEPPNTFSQTVDKGDGTSTNSQNDGRKAGFPSAKKTKEQAVKASVEVFGQGDAFRSEIDSKLDDDDFFNWLRLALVAQMTRAYEDGFLHFGGLGELNYAVLQDAPQGIAFQNSRLDAFVGDTAGGTPQRLRALMYAGAVHNAYLLGAQQAMASHGAKGWQRVLHPELSVSGPCPDCQADSNVIHSITEPFFEFHPNGRCTAQSVQYHLSDGVTFPVRMPDFINRVVRR